MQLNSLKPTHKNYQPAPIGRGGKRGKTSGRGGKGQTARAGHKIRPEMRDIIKKFPKRRGYGRNRSRTVRISRFSYAPVNLAALEATFPTGAVITPAALLAKGLVRPYRGRTPQVKILGSGEISKNFTITSCTLSSTARAALEKAGATIN